MITSNKKIAILALFFCAVQAQSEEAILSDIAAQPLDSALRMLAEQTGLQILYAAEIGENRDSPGTDQASSAAQALEQLLTDTGLEYRYINEHTVTVRDEDQENPGLGKNKPASNENLIAQVGTSAQQSQTTGRSQAKSGAEDTGDIGFRLEEIVVRARKRDENIQDVPISIAPFSQEDITSLSVRSLKELGQFATNLSFFQSEQGGGHASVFIRGVGQLNVSPSRDPGVGVYVDGVYLARMQGLDFDLAEVERIEVLRGPQGTLFGKNTTGGAINTVTLKPDLDEFSGSAEVTVGRYDRIDGRLGVNVPLIPGELATRLSVSSRNRDGYGRHIDFATGDTLVDSGSIDRLSARGSVYWEPTENFNGLLSFDYSDFDETSTPRKYVYVPGMRTPMAIYNRFPFINPPVTQANFGTADNYSNFSDALDTDEMETWGVSLNLSWDFGDDLNLKSITAYRDSETLVSNDSDGTPHQFIQTVRGSKFDQFSQEIQLSGQSFDDRLNWLVGMFYFEESIDENNRAELAVELFRFLGLPLPGNAVQLNDNDGDSIAVFGQGTYSINDRLSLTAGVRYTDEQKSYAQDTIHSLLGVPLPGLVQTKVSFDSVTARAGLEYRFNDNLMVYASWAEGFLSGGVNTDVDAVAAGAPPSYRPEELTTYEIGLKSDHLDGRLRFNAAGFYSDYEDIQIQVTTAAVVGGVVTTGADTFVGNAAKARIWGFEMDAELVPVENLTLAAGIGHLDAKYTELGTATAAAVRGLTTDTNFVRTPKWSATLSASYLMPLTGNGDIRADVKYSFKSAIEHNIPNNNLLTQDGYGLLNARLTWVSPGESWEMSVFGTNLTDEEYIMASTNFESLGLINATYATPTEWGVSLKYNF